MSKLDNAKANNLLLKLAISAVGLVLTAGVPSITLAQGAAQGASGAGVMTQMPQTAAEHRARAEQYVKEAAASRADAEAHRKMLADYTKTVATNPKAPVENPFIKGMKQHCDGYIKAAEKLASEADEMAKLHSMRAKELEGK